MRTTEDYIKKNVVLDCPMCVGKNCFKSEDIAMSGNKNIVPKPDIVYFCSKCHFASRFYSEVFKGVI